MAGYIGTKAVLLSTTAATVTGDMTVGGAATISGATTVTGPFTSLGIDDNAAATAMTIDASGNVGIGTDAPAAKLVVSDTTGATIRIESTKDGTWTDGESFGALEFYGSDTSGTGPGVRAGIEAVSAGTFGLASSLLFKYNNGGGPALEAMRIDSSGTVLVGKSTNNATLTGMELRGNGVGVFTRASSEALYANRLTTDGEIIKFAKDTTTVGSIGSSSGQLKVTSSTRDYLFGTNNFFALHDNLIDLGSISFRWDDVYATNGTIQTSDRNEKTDIDVLNAAETAVAQACKGLLRKFRWKDAVAEKGDDARIHFGIIAQDLQDAFAAQGLDAGNYAMFISSTWWEADRIIPAVEAVAEELDEDGNVIVEAVEAVAEQTVTDTFETLKEAPEGATERTRLGVRYPELLAFIIGAM